MILLAQGRTRLVSNKIFVVFMKTACVHTIPPRWTNRRSPFVRAATGMGTLTQDVQPAVLCALEKDLAASTPPGEAEQCARSKPHEHNLAVIGASSSQGRLRCRDNQLPAGGRSAATDSRGYGQAFRWLLPGRLCTDIPCAAFHSSRWDPPISLVLDRPRQNNRTGMHPCGCLCAFRTSLPTHRCVCLTTYQDFYPQTKGPPLS